jgi:hypothetical protein
MSLWSKIRGTQELLFQLGLGGPNVKNNAGAVENRNAGDTAFAIVRGASPQGDNDLVTKAYADTLSTRSIVTAQISGASALPNNSAVEHFIVVSTTGGTGTIGQLYWDDGSNSGTVTVIPATSGSMILTTVALSGGTVSFKADTLYMWDTVAGAWTAASGAGASGSLRVIRLAITNAASQSSASTIPANAVVVDTKVDITTPYSAGATITVGQTGSAALLQGTGDNLATVAGVYETSQDVAWGASALAVLVTVTGAPAAGAGFVVVQYVVADS